MSENDFVDTLLETFTHPLRGAILYQLLKGKITASQIGENLGEKPDKIYYHLKILKTHGFLGEPEVVVRKNYIEKYYELTPQFRENLLSSAKELAEREKKMDSEEFKRLMLSFLSMAISLLQGYKKKLENVDKRTIESIREENNFEIKPVFFEDALYQEWLKNTRDISHGSLMDMFTKGAEGNIGMVVALPALE